MHPRTSVGREYQDNVLERLLERRLVTTIFLRNRMTLRGRVIEYDPYVLLLEPLDGTPAHLVYKSSIVSISAPPNRPPQRGPRRDFRERRSEADRPGGGGGEGYPPRREFSNPPHFNRPGPRQDGIRES
jgi:RNA chaperone Hfq